MSVTVYHGHAPAVLASLPERTVHVTVCSPPYLWLRAYGTEPQVWGDGWVGEVGQEPTPEQYVVHLLEVFRAVHRVLRDDGTLWVNLAGSYFNDAGGQNGGAGNTLDYGAGRISPKAMEANRQNGRQKRQKHPYFKPLDYVDTPGLFRDAMLRDGWHRGIEMTLVKTAPLPESVRGVRWERCRVKVAKGEATMDGKKQANPEYRLMAGFNERYFEGQGMAEWEDCPGCPKCLDTDGLVLRWGSGRPARATEKLFVFAKGARYFWDQEAVRVPVSPASLADGRTARGQRGTKGEYGAVDGNCGFSPSGRNLWDWVTWRPEPSSLKHYASYPKWLPRLAITAGTSERGVCPHCGDPWARVVDARSVERDELPPDDPRYRPSRYDNGKGAALYGAGHNGQRYFESATIGWRPTCSCQAHEPIPATVLDCFGGSGTTGLVADQLGRDAVLIDLQPNYVAMAEQRITQDAPLLVELERARPAAAQLGLFEGEGVGG